MTLLAVLLLCQDPAADIDRLIRELADDRIEVRERSHARLLASGPSAIPALRKAAHSLDAEFRIRVDLLLEIVDRAERERIHDADQKNALLLLHRDASKEVRPGSAAREGARFDLSARPFEDGWIISTRVFNYLIRQSDPGPGQGLLDFEVKSVVDADGKEAALERCERCSPTKVFVRAANGPWKVRVTGNQVWFSPYHLEFKSPVLGQKKRVGDYSIEVGKLHLKVSSPTSFSREWIRSMNTICEIELRPDVTVGRFRGIWSRTIG